MENPHLRLQAAHARMRVLSGEWAIRHLPGLRMADLGTKALTANRLVFLKRELQMSLSGNVLNEAEKHGTDQLPEKGADDLDGVSAVRRGSCHGSKDAHVGSHVASR